jgi:hypothetical protein
MSDELDRLREELRAETRKEIAALKKYVELLVETKLAAAMQEVSEWYTQVVSVVHTQAKYMDAHKAIEHCENALAAIKKRWPPRMQSDNEVMKP